MAALRVKNTFRSTITGRATNPQLTKLTTKSEGENASATLAHIFPNNPSPPLAPSTAHHAQMLCTAQLLSADKTKTYFSLCLKKDFTGGS